MIIFGGNNQSKRMKFSIYVLLFVVGFTSCINEQVEEIHTSEVDESTIIKPLSYDSVLAQKYGADEYSMRQYVIAFLKEGPNREVDSATAHEIFVAHMNNIDRMAENGDLILAGPFLGQDDLRGLYIFNVKTIEEAEELTNTDPAIKSGYLEMELREWYGSAGLMGLNDVHKQVQKKGVLDN